MTVLDCDFFIVGSGIAGLLTALRLARYGRVVIATKKERADSNTNYAQGGIACVMRSDDSFEEHIRDTLECGAGLCDERVVRRIVTSGPERIAELEQLGIRFSGRNGDEDGEYDLGREGGHSRRRVLHAGDITGREVETVLLKRIHDSRNVMLMEHAMVIDLITLGWLDSRLDEADDRMSVGLDGNRCVGAYVLDRNRGEILAVRAPHVILASGGGGKVYLYTSNPDIATADGVAMAWRAGLPIVNMEFIQFHPTCLFHPEAKSFLISEAVRGEGGHLVDAAGRRFMDEVDPRGDLAPRDIVARAIDSRMKATGAACMFLDIRHKGQRFLKERFPNIVETCLRYGIDMATDLVPVVPAAHYFCGGIRAAVDGSTDLAGLYACGEAACTGLHGANRLASNSLLEAIVCAHELSARVVSERDPVGFKRPVFPPWEYGDAVTSDEAIVVEHNWNEVRTCMWDYVGIVRTDKRLERAARRIRNLRHEIRQYYLDYIVTADVLELRNIAGAAELIIRAARNRHESRGLHYTLDYPDPVEPPRDTIIADPPGSRVLSGNT